MDFSPVYGKLNENQLLRAQKKTRREYRCRLFTVTVYLFQAKIMCVFWKLPNKGILVYFSPVYGTLNENQLLRLQQNQEGDTDISCTVTVHLFLAKNTMSFFYWGFDDVLLSSSSKKPTEQHTHDHVCTYHRKRPPTNNTKHTWHNTANEQHRASPNNAQQWRHGVIKRTIGGSLARS